MRDALDFSALSPDQLLALIRGALAEAASRNPAVQAAAREAVLDEAEKARIATEAAEREARLIRARERERIAQQAAARVRAAVAESEAKATERERIAHAQAEALARATAAQRETARALAVETECRNLILRAAALVDLPPERTSLYVNQHDAFINESGTKYGKDHLVAYRGREWTIKLKSHLRNRRDDLLAFCAELKVTWSALKLDGSDYFPVIPASNTHEGAST